jgi:hypothetical protein
MVVSKCFLSLYIPIAAAIFCCIPPVVLVCELLVLEEGFQGLMDVSTGPGKLLKLANKYTDFLTNAISNDEVEGSVPTSRGCKVRDVCIGALAESSLE